MNIRTLTATIALSLALSTSAVAGNMKTKNPMVGGAPMYPTKDIIDNAVNSKDHTTLVAAVKAAGLVDTLKGPGPFTVFAPTNAAFATLPAGTVDTLLKPENKATLTGILTYHVVPGRMDAKALDSAIEGRRRQGHADHRAGRQRSPLWRMGKMFMLTDAKGNKSSVTIGNVYQ